MIDGVVVSDFYTPHFFDPKASAGVRYSFTGALTRPRQVLRGGYLSWLNPETNSIQQLRFFGGAPIIKDLGAATANRSLRESVDTVTKPLKLSGFAPSKAVTERRQAIERASVARSRDYDAAEHAMR